MMLVTAVTLSTGWGEELKYAPAPVDNPLKGMVPYVSSDALDRFPHSMEFQEFALKAVMKGRGEYDWGVVEKTLKKTQGRGCQLVMRFYLEYPGHGNEVPEFLVEEGVKVTKWTGDDGVSFTPDYEDAKLRSALREFVAAFGKKYDGDARVGFLTAGLLGSWGEWHTYPREDLWASKEVQAEVMDGLEKAFRRTPVLVRYPAGPKSWGKASNVERSFGYHDDSFGWATLETGREEDDWFFLAEMKEVGALEKWKTVPIGGELRPELWKQSFTDKPHAKDQGFRKCVEATHATWLMDTGLFEKRYPLSEERKAKALEEVRRMGYEYHIAKAEVTEKGMLELTVENRGVAPFYGDWAVEVEFGGKGTTMVDRQVGLTAGILPGEERVWKFRSQKEAEEIRVRVRNPMEGGKPLRFANEGGEGEWMVVR